MALSDKQLILVKENEGLVRVIANRMCNQALKSLTYDDLFQAGYIGLMKAAERYKPSEGKFSSYAGKYIEGHIYREIYDADNIIRIPSTTRQNAVKFIKEHSETGISLEEYCRRDNRDYDVMKSAIKALRTVVSLDKPVTSTENYHSIVENITEDEEDTYKDIYLNSLREYIKNYADKHLSERERNVIRMYFYEEMTLGDINRYYNSTQASAVLARALRKLRHPLCSRGLRPYIEG